MAASVYRSYNTIVPQINTGYAGSIGRPASSPIRNPAASVTPMPLTSPRFSPGASPLRIINDAPANGVAQQTTPIYHSIQGVTPRAPLTARGTAPMSARGEPPKATGVVPTPTMGHRQVLDSEPIRISLGQTVVPTPTMGHRQVLDSEPIRISLGQTREHPPSQEVSIPWKSFFDSVPEISLKNPSTAHLSQTRDLLTESITDSTRSPADATDTDDSTRSPQTPSTTDDELVKDILAQAEAARQRATRALNICKESVSLSKARCMRSSQSSVRQSQMNNRDPNFEVMSPSQDLVAATDLVAASIDTPPETPPLQRVAPAYQEPLSPDTSCAQLKGFEGLFAVNSVANLKEGCSTPPWPTRLVKANVPAHIVRPHSYVLRDIDKELETLNTDLLEQPKTSRGMESFEEWRASLLASPLN